ncbi:MAG: glycosyltransferase family 39 protein [Thermoguttaceae bacterium]
MLLLACLIPRAVAAWNWDVLWGDSLHYVYASLALEQGNFDEGFAEFGLNLYPLILIPLRHLGVDWQIAGKCFGVLMASFTVVPLWGWLRRMFDDRLAAIACLVYALHGKLIAISPLIIRDSTFWFLLALALYYVWRAVCELRIGFFFAAGVALTLAVHTRTEGWLLLIPLLGWGACRWPSAEGKRFRLALGTLLCIAVIPATVTVVNFTWLRENPRWEFLRTDHLQMAIDWWNSASGMHVRLPYRERAIPVQNPFLKTNPPRFAATLPVAATSPAAKPAAQPSPPPFSSDLMPALPPPERSAPSWTLTFKLLERLVKGCTWVGSLLLLVGLVCGWRILLRSEHLTLFCMSLALLAITRIRYWTGGLDLRYFMPVVIVGVPWIALGLEHALAGTCRLFQRWGEISPRALSAFVGSLIILAVTCSFLDGPMSAAACMRKHAALGRWMYNRAGPEPAIVGNLDYKSLEAFYSNGRVVGILLPTDRPSVPMPVALTERKADVVILWNEENLGHDRLAIIERQVTGHGGYRRVDAKEFPAGENELMVFVKGD